MKKITISLLLFVVLIAVLSVLCVDDVNGQFELSGLSFHAVVDEEDPYYNGKIVYNNQVIDNPDELKQILINKQPIPNRASVQDEKVDCKVLVLQKVSSLFFKKQSEEYTTCTHLKECMFKYARDVVLHLLQVFEMKADLEFPTGKTLLNLIMDRIDQLAKDTYANFQTENDKILESKECESQPDQWIKPLFSFNGKIYKNPCKAAQDGASHPLTDISFHSHYTSMESFDYPRPPRSSLPKRILLKHYLKIVIRIIKCIQTYLKDQCLLSTDSRVLEHSRVQLELIVSDLDQIPLPDLSSNQSSEFIEQVLQLQKDTIQNIKIILEQISRHFA